MLKGGKAELRTHYRQQRKAAIAAAEARILAVAVAELPGRVPAGKLLGLYWPLAHEPDLRPVAHLLSRRLALPAVLPGKGLIYLPWALGQELGRDACGIQAPVEASPLDPQELGLLLVPSLAVTPDGLRLGSGGGWYDRLRAHPHWSAVPALAVLPAACVASSLPRDPWDIPFTGWLDENGVHPARNQQHGMTGP